MLSRVGDVVHPSLFDYVLYARNRGLVGEEQNFLTILLSLVNPNLNVILEGPSGAAKTTIADAAINLCGGGYYTITPGSAKKDIYDSRMHDAEILYVPELQQAALTGDFTVEMLKTFGEGKDYEYGAAGSGRSVKDRESEPIKIWCKNFLTTIALQNKHRDDVLDMELQRRLIRLYTDVSAVANRAVVDDKAKRASGLTEDIPVVRVSVDELSEHIWRTRSTIREEDVVIPYMYPYISDALDSSFVVSRTIVSQIIELIKSVAAFHAHDRGRDELGRIVAEPSDAWIVSELAFESFGAQALQLPSMGVRILEVFSKLSAEEIVYIKDHQPKYLDVVSLTPSLIQDKLKSAGYNLDAKTVGNECKALVESGYMALADGTSKARPRYVKQHEQGQRMEISWAKLLKQVVNGIQVYFVTNPVTNDDVDLMKITRTIADVKTGGKGSEKKGELTLHEF